MRSDPTVRIRIQEQSQVGEGWRAAQDRARALGLDDAACGRCAIAASELGSNLVKHAGGGDLFIGSFSDADGAGLELLAVDRGRGMLNVERCLQDGYSTAGTVGNGLGAVVRNADVFDIHSQQGKGTVVLARVRHEPTVAERRGVILGSLLIPYPGETACGDNWGYAGEAGDTLFVVDGLGHGREAEKAAHLAVHSFLNNAGRSCVEIMQRVHAALAPTRGAAAALARIDHRRQAVDFVGIGNISGSVVTINGVRKMVSHNGTAGHLAPRIAVFSYPYDPGSLLIMHSDGVSARWDAGAYPGLITRHPAVVAGVLCRDHARGRDDMCMAALRVVR